MKVFYQIRQVVESVEQANAPQKCLTWAELTKKATIIALKLACCVKSQMILIQPLKIGISMQITTSGF